MLSIIPHVLARTLLFRKEILNWILSELDNSRRYTDGNGLVCGANTLLLKVWHRFKFGVLQTCGARPWDGKKFPANRAHSLYKNKHRLTRNWFQQQGNRWVIRQSLRRLSISKRLHSPRNPSCQAPWGFRGKYPSKCRGCL